MMENDEPTEITRADIDNVMARLESGEFDSKLTPCTKCGKEHLTNYGNHWSECDECFFARFPKEQRQAFFRSFFE